jgi:hypothetical protein
VLKVNQLEISFGTPLVVIHKHEQEARLCTCLQIWYDGFTLTLKGDHVMYTLPVDHTVKMQVSYVDGKGNPATIDGAVSWASSDETIAHVHADDADSTICRVVPLGAVGQVQITASCDADLGDGVRELLTIADIDIVGGEAVAGSIEPTGPADPIIINPPDAHVEHH